MQTMLFHTMNSLSIYANSKNFDEITCWSSNVAWYVLYCDVKLSYFIQWYKFVWSFILYDMNSQNFNSIHTDNGSEIVGKNQKKRSNKKFSNEIAIVAMCILIWYRWWHVIQQNNQKSSIKVLFALFAISFFLLLRTNF